MNENIYKLMIIIRDLANQHFSREYKSLEEVLSNAKDLTRKLWSNHHGEIITELENLNRILNRDYQLFWFECLKFPPAWPEMKDLKGNSYYRNYYGLPSDFNEISYHDSEVNRVSLSNDLELEIDLIENWKDEESGWRQQGCKAKLVFHEVKKILIDDFKDGERVFKRSDLKVNDLEGTTIFDFIEVPAIDHFLIELMIEKNGEINGNRIFVLDTQIDSYNRVTIICKNWYVQKYGNQHDIGFAFKVND